jgi:hypothetical protein
MVGARHGMCELTPDMAWERHGRGMLCVNPPLVWAIIFDLSGMGGPTSSYATAGIALRII